MKEYYWCPLSAYYRLTLWSEKPTHSMQAGGLDGWSRQHLLEQLDRHEPSIRELLWEHPVTSRRLGLTGRADLIAVTGRDTIIVVEAKLSVTPRRLYTRQLHLAAQLAAYTVAAEETLGLPAEKALLYSTETRRLIPVRIGPRLRSLVEHAARSLHEALETGRPPAAGSPDPRRCAACGYRGICPRSRASTGTER